MKNKKNSGKKIALGVGIGVAIAGIAGAIVCVIRRLNKSMNSVAYSISHSYCECDDEHACCDVSEETKEREATETAASDASEA